MPADHPWLEWTRRAGRRRRITTTTSDRDSGFDPHSRRDVDVSTPDACGAPGSQWKERQRADAGRHHTRRAATAGEQTRVADDRGIRPVAVASAGQRDCVARAALARESADAPADRET